MSCRESEEWLERFCQLFFDLHGREPSDEEIEEALHQAEAEALLDHEHLIDAEAKEH